MVWCGVVNSHGESVQYSFSRGSVGLYIVVWYSYYFIYPHDTPCRFRGPHLELKHTIPHTHVLVEYTINSIASYLQ